MILEIDLKTLLLCVSLIIFAGIGGFMYMIHRGWLSVE